MCLYADSTKARRAAKPIECYKSVNMSIRTESNDYVSFESAFQNFTYEAGGAYYEKEFERERPGRIVSCGFHSHLNLIEAEREADDRYYPANTVLRCEIPAGALYYSGETTYGGTDLCSDVIYVTGWKYPGEKRWHETPVRKPLKPFRMKLRRIFKK